ncbi:hypothetical protein L3X38_016742 [Prunus dulcis]|uniref:Uncharacterized protein n=1 Tax=Prunus dulcis TaxID=3755 RepID=A0AAD4W8E3_PRUDU|nr:hypothetical protein L3X38_016742 [Prunus dulcis]
MTTGSGELRPGEGGDGSGKNGEAEAELTMRWIGFVSSERGKPVNLAGKVSLYQSTLLTIPSSYSGGLYYVSHKASIGDISIIVTNVKFEVYNPRKINSSNNYPLRHTPLRW